MHGEEESKGVIIEIIFEEWYGRYVRRPDDDDVIYVTAASSKLAMEGEYLAPMEAPVCCK